MISTFVVTAAGGNPTAIEVIDSPRTRQGYEEAGKRLMDQFEKMYGVEQSGSLVLVPNSIPHFEMSGGEFCGNAARSAALILSNIQGNSKVQFTMSSLTTPIKADVHNDFVQCIFQDFPLSIKKVNILGEQACVVEMKGIVHIVLSSAFPDNFETKHATIRDELNLNDRLAVGVVWMKQEKKGVVKIDPVVWVHSIDTFFHETSCGSGSIAAAAATETEKMVVIQPTGREIRVIIDHNTVNLSSTMEVRHE